MHLTTEPKKRFAWYTRETSITKEVYIIESIIGAGCTIEGCAKTFGVSQRYVIDCLERYSRPAHRVTVLMSEV